MTHPLTVCLIILALLSLITITPWFVASSALCFIIEFVMMSIAVELGARLLR